MKYATLFLVLFPVLCSSACLLPEDVENFIDQLERSHFAGLDTQVDSSDPEMLRYRITIEDGIFGSFAWCWRTALTEQGIEVDCLSRGVMGVSTDPNQSEHPETFEEDEAIIHSSFDGVYEDYVAFVEQFDIEPQMVEVSAVPRSYCDAEPASNKSQQEGG